MFQGATHEGGERAPGDVVQLAIQSEERYGIGREHDLTCYADVLEAAGVRVVLVSTDDIRDLPPGWCRAGSSRVVQTVLERYVPDISRRTVHISGPPAMVEAVAASARALNARAVRTDFFSGY